MSVSTQITRLQNARTSLQETAESWGLVASGENYLTDELAEEYAKVAVTDSTGGSVYVSGSLTIPKGFHKNDEVYTVSGATEEYDLETGRSATPTTSTQTITPGYNTPAGRNYYGLASVVINPIPAKYQDVSSVTAAASDVLANKVIVAKDGTVTTGTMSNNGAVSKTLNTATTSYAIPAGYHNGSGSVSITLENKTATPTEEAQEIVPTDGKVLNKVTVNAIPSKYADASNTNALASHILSGKKAIAWDSTNNVPIAVTGTMVNNTATTNTLNCGGSYTIPAGYHDGNGKVTANSLASQTGVDSGKTAITAAQVLTGYQGWVNGSKVSGTMANNGSVSTTFNPITQSSITIATGYTSGGTITLTSDLETALSAI